MMRGAVFVYQRAERYRVTSFLIMRKWTTRLKLKNIWILILHFICQSYTQILADLAVERRELVLLGQLGAEDNGCVDLIDVARGESQAGRPSRSLTCIPSRTAGFEDLFFLFRRRCLPPATATCCSPDRGIITPTYSDYVHRGSGRYEPGVISQIRTYDSYSRYYY